VEIAAQKMEIAALTEELGRITEDYDTLNLGFADGATMVPTVVDPLKFGRDDLRGLKGVAYHNSQPIIAEFQALPAPNRTL
jgi:hypothetical protein